MVKDVIVMVKKIKRCSGPKLLGEKIGEKSGLYDKARNSSTRNGLMV